mmetsp:Transcript_13226/g.30103  ORF Transcript_13226/g.30103 Transcript_13226/m.30103 type:complete len:666 (+) Transcript_13226:178-2175(+)
MTAEECPYHPTTLTDSSFNERATIAWKSKELTLDQVSKKINSGSNVYIGSMACTPDAILNAMVDDYKLADLRVVQMIPGGTLPHMSQTVDRFRTCSFFSYRKTAYYKKSGGRESLADYTPISIASIPRLLEQKKLPVDVAIIKCTPPHKGFISLGIGVEHTHDFMRSASVVIAEVNSHMPWTEGKSKILASEVDWWVRHDEPMPTTEKLWPDLVKVMTKGDPQKNVEEKMARNVINLVDDGATIKFGWSPLTFSIFPFLKERKNLGLHTDVMTDALVYLMEEGVINNSLKTVDRGRTVVSQAYGGRELYEFLDRNPAVEFHPSSYVNDPQVMARIDNLVSIVGALKVDLTGQIATDSIAHNFYGSVWSDVDSIRGARYSKGGKPIVILRSMSLQGRSNIVFALPPGTGVAITRSDVEYVVTEYGTAYLDGKSVRERCLALIDIAHPIFRQELLNEAKKYRYISESQPGKSFLAEYPQKLECTHTTKTGKQVFVRPIKAVDEDALRTFFHKLSDRSVYLRYFRKLQSMPQRILQRYTDVNYSSDMALVVFSPADGPNREMVAIGQWLSDPLDEMSAPEVAFQVRDDWQGEGLGSYLFRRLVDISDFFGVHRFKADVLGENRGMQAVFKNSKVPHVTRSDFGTITYMFDLTKVERETVLSNGEIQEK